MLYNKLLETLDNIYFNAQTFKILSNQQNSNNLHKTFDFSIENKSKVILIGNSSLPREIALSPHCNFISLHHFISFYQSHILLSNEISTIDFSLKHGDTILFKNDAEFSLGLTLILNREDFILNSKQNLISLFHINSELKDMQIILNKFKNV